MKFRVELRDASFNVLEILDREVVNLSWSYSRIGGCGEFNFKLPRKIFEEKSISGDFNIRIYNRDSLTGNYNLWYQGLVENKIPTLRGNSEDIEISGHGYNVQLGRIYLNNITYTGQEVSVIVKSILDNYVVPSTNISYSASDIESTSITLDSINFNETAQSALSKLADITGSREYGVDKNRNFFFKLRSSSVGFIYPFGKNITNFQENQDFTEIVNQIIIQGAQSGGTYFTAGPYNDTPSQLKYNLRSNIIQNSSITTSQVAQLYATSTFSEFNDVIRKSNFELVGIEAQIESTIPIPMVTILGKEVAYGEKYYGTFLYSGLVNRTINRINYNVSNNNSLKIGIDAGQLRPTIAEDLAFLEYELDQLRSASL